MIIDLYMTRKMCSVNTLEFPDMLIYNFIKVVKRFEIEFCIQ